MRIRSKYTLIYGLSGLVISFILANIIGGFTKLILGFILENRTDPYNLFNLFDIIPIAITLLTIFFITLASFFMGWQIGRKKELKQRINKDKNPSPRPRSG